MNTILTYTHQHPEHKHHNKYYNNYQHNLPDQHQMYNYEADMDKLQQQKLPLVHFLLLGILCFV